MVTMSRVATTPSATQLPIWPEDLRGLPNARARSALFTVANVRKGARTSLKRHQIASVKGITVTYTGEELRQDDEDVFLQLLHIARMSPLGTEVQFTAWNMLGQLQWTRNTAAYTRLADCVERLKATALSVTVELGPTKETFSGSLVRKFRMREPSKESSGQAKHWLVTLEREIVVLFGNIHYSRLDWDLRLQLPPLAKWLHAFYSTHAEPYAYSVARLHILTGSETKQLKQFRYKLREALQLLVSKGFLLHAEVDSDDLVQVART